MANNNRKVVLIGTGMVGMSFAYAALNQSVCDELVLIDLNEVRAKGEAMDLNHGLAFSNSSMKIYYGDYSNCRDADIAVICAGVNQKPGESRLELLQRNTKVFSSIVPRVVSNGFDGIFLVATNPVDIMTRVTHVHAYVIGEHGDSEFVPWSQALMAVNPVLDVLKKYPDRFSMDDLDRISNDVRTAAYEIIRAKGSTYYGIGMAICRIVRAIFTNENSVFTASVRLRGEYGLRNEVFIGNPCIINSGGANRLLELSLTDDELEQFKKSYMILNESFHSLDL